MNILLAQKKFLSGKEVKKDNLLVFENCQTQGTVLRINLNY